jgi:long-chain acyl-CoA synthetase
MAVSEECDMSKITQDTIVTDTIAKTFMNAVAHWGDRIALREKDMGIWQSKTWREWRDVSVKVAYALAAEDLKPGEVVSILSNTNPEWIYVDMGALIAGGVCSGIYPTDSPKQCDYLINDSSTVICFVEDDEQLDKMLQIRERCPTLRRIVILDMDGLRDFQDPMCVSFDDFLAKGAAHMAGRDGLLQQMLDSRTAEDIAILVYTSGTTGPPKGAMHSNRSVGAQMKHAKTLYRSEPGDDRLLFLPLCHVAERLGGYYTSLPLGPVMNFAESPETVPDNIREVQPRAFLAVPRVWEKFYSGVQIAMQDATSFEKWVYKTALGLGYKVADARLAGREPGIGLKVANALGQRFVLKNIRKMIGIDKSRMLFTGAAPISPDLIRWYLALGVNMYEVYGQTENCGVATAMPIDKIKLGTIGKCVPWGELKISDQGEILLRGDFLMSGYLNKPDKTAEAIDSDGWLHTGDVGTIDAEGYVKITDRMKDIIITAGGKNITPSEIENQLKFSPYISDAVVIGDKRAFLTCLVMIDLENVEKFAQDRNIPFTNYASLCRAKEVQDLIWGEIEKVNANFARVETIKKFHLIDTQLTAEDEELTPTLKLKRSFVNKKYAKEIDAMYGRGEKVAA